MTLLRTKRINVVLLGLSLLLAAVPAGKRVAAAAGAAPAHAAFYVAAIAPAGPGPVGPDSQEGDWPW